MQKLTYTSIILILGLLIAPGCRKDRDIQDSRVPVVPTDVTINLNLPQYQPLANPGGFAYVIGGSRGIVVYRYGLEDFAAFDRHCTFEVQEGCTIEVEEASVATDLACCESSFEIVNGLPTEGPAIRPLLRYNTQFNPNANLLRIFNQ
ncbi:MAG: hypothetical protein ABR574_01965 [Cryomorphaceae bacterium]|nr:hypothetical protein [Flavobacteriales bacterium]